jgi:NitT/TauT family transport system substrate-binding protein
VRFMLKGMMVAAGLLTTILPATAAEMKHLVVAEPVHGVGYLPLYIAVDKGYFAKEGLDVKVLTVEGGSAHTNAVLSGQAFAFIGGPEHDAYAKLKGAELRSVVNVVDRGNVYYVAAKGKGPTDKNYAAYFKGKVVDPGLFGGTPNSITRYLLSSWKLAPGKDVTLLETTTAGILAAVKTGHALIAAVSEPMLTAGVKDGIWDEPFYNVPKELGPYAYSTLNVRLQSIKEEPKTVAAFVRGVIMGLHETYAHPDEATAIARKEFPTMPPEALQATLDRTYADELWSHDGMVSEASWLTAEKVVRGANILKADVAYDAIIDMEFVKSTLASMK